MCDSARKWFQLGKKLKNINRQIIGGSSTAIKIRNKTSVVNGLGRIHVFPSTLVSENRWYWSVCICKIKYDFRRNQIDVLTNQTNEQNFEVSKKIEKNKWFQAKKKTNGYKQKKSFIKKFQHEKIASKPQAICFKKSMNDQDKKQLHWHLNKWHQPKKTIE